MLKNRIKKIYKSYMLRPTIYMIITKLLIVLLVGGLWAKFGNTLGLFSAAVHVSSGFAVIYAALAWFAFLRLDGVKLPRLKPKQKKRRQRKQSTADLIDHLDTEIKTYDELLPEEFDVCSLFSSLATCLLLFLVAFLL